MKNRALGLLIIVVVLIGVVAWLRESSDFVRSLPGTSEGKDKGSSIHPPQQLESLPRKSSRQLAATKQPILTPPSDSVVASVIAELKRLELERTEFCRELENEERILQEFVMQYPSLDEAELIRRHISRVKGLTRDGDGTLVSWQELLTRRYLWHPRFENCIVTTIHRKQSRRGEYTVLGVPTGQLKLREGNAPISADGGIYFLYSSSFPEDDSAWRFSHLFESAHDDPTRSLRPKAARPDGSTLQIQ